MWTAFIIVNTFSSQFEFVFQEGGDQPYTHLCLALYAHWCKCFSTTAHDTRRHDWVSHLYRWYILWDRRVHYRAKTLDWYSVTEEDLFGCLGLYATSTIQTRHWKQQINVCARFCWAKTEGYMKTQDLDTVRTSMLARNTNSAKSKSYIKLTASSSRCNLSTAHHFVLI